LIRCPRLARYIIDGKVIESDFPVGIHKAVFNSAVEVLRVLGNRLPENGIEVTSLNHPLRLMISNGVILAEEVDALASLLFEMYAEILQPDFYESSISSYLAERRTTVALSRQGILNDPMELAESLMETVLSSRIERNEAISPLLDISLEAPEEVVPTGLVSIDQYMNGGLGKGRSGMICGFTGIGKTSFAVNIGWGAAEQGFQARIATLELTANEVKKRLYSRVARYDYARIQFGDPPDAPNALTYEEIQEEVRSRIHEFGGNSLGNLRIYDLTSEVATVPLIEDYLRRDREAGCPADMLVVDWLECLELPIGKRGKSIQDIPIKELRHKIEKIAGDLTAMAVRQNIALWIMTQSDFAAEGKSTVTMSNKSEAKGASRKCSWFLGLGMSTEDERQGIIHVTASKARNGRVFSTRLARCLDQQRFESPDMGVAQQQQPPTEFQVQSAGFN
jgi:KaiC/GvpD/RAD55 family RecA-like ATPase